MSDFHRTRAYWHFWAGEALRGSSPVYAAIARRIGDDDDLKSLCDVRKAGQPPANLLFGAVHFLLLGGAKDPLPRFYPHLGGSHDADPEAAFPFFRAFCLRHEKKVRDLIAARVTNTNEVRRSTFLLPMLHAAHEAAGLPLYLVEVGPSAGLNLNFDRYAYRYQDADGQFVTAGDPASPLLLEAELRGRFGAIAVPPIARRVGLELNPVDLSLEEDRRWLKALLWPGLNARFQRLDAALQIAMAAPPPIRSGSALDTLAAALDETPAGSVPVVMHSVVTYQFSPEMNEAFAAIIAMASRHRLVMEVSCEYDGKAYPMMLTRHEGGTKTQERLLGEAHQHGDWLVWHA